jgi:hypothetical protein
MLDTAHVLNGLGSISSSTSWDIGVDHGQIGVQGYLQL